MRQMVGPQALAEPILTKPGAGNECRGLGDGDFGDRGGGRGGSGASSIVAWSMRIRCSTKRTTCGLACHSCANFGTHRPKLRDSDGLGRARALRSDKGQRSCRRLAMVRSCQDTSWPWILRKRPARPGSCPMGRSLSATRAENTVRAIKLVELKTTSLDDAVLIADETEQRVSVVIAPAVVTKRPGGVSQRFLAVPQSKS